jgi:hypothetical protein
LLTSRWRNPASSALGARRALWPRPTSPPPRPQTPPRSVMAPQRHAPSPPRRAQAPPSHAPPLSWTAWRRALLHPSQSLSPLPPPRHWARGAQAPTSRGELGPHRSSPPRPTTSTPKSPGKRVPAARTAGTPHSSVPGAPGVRSSSPSCAPPAPVPAAVPHARARARGIGGSDRVAFTVTSCRE